MYYEKLDIIKPYHNKLRSSYSFFLLEAFFETKRWMHANPTLYEHNKEYKKYFVEEYDKSSTPRQLAAKLLEDVTDSTFAPKPQQ